MTSRIVAFLLLLLPALASAQQALCSITSNPGMGFGLYDDSSASDTNSASTITVNCLRNGGPPNPDVTLTLGPSANSGLITTRQMKSGANVMNYNLYRDSGRSQVWGQTPGVDAMTITVTGIPNNGSKNATFTVYGRIPAQQNVGVGGYSDSVQMTISP